MSGPSSNIIGTSPGNTFSSGPQRRLSSWAARSSIASRPNWSSARGSSADVAEAQQRLEQFNLDLTTRTSDVITTERELRNVLGLPPADDRRIVPISVPVEARLEPDWEKSVAEMHEKQPAIVQLKTEATESTPTAGVSDAVTRTFLPDLASQATVFGFFGFFEPTHREPTSLESDSLRQVTHRAAHPGPLLPRDRRRLQAVPDREEAEGGRGSATRRPACLLRGRPDHDRPAPRWGEPVRPAVAQEGRVQVRL